MPDEPSMTRFEELADQYLDKSAQMTAAQEKIQRLDREQRDLHKQIAKHLIDDHKKDVVRKVYGSKLFIAQVDDDELSRSPADPTMQVFDLD